MRKTCVLLVLDGWGIGRSDFSNPLRVANLEHIDYIKKHYPIGGLQAAGIAVGLPWGEEGNSEVGHLTIGAGKVIYQHYPRITLAIQDGSFFKNEILLKAFNHAKENKSVFHIATLLTEGNIHASFEHLESLLQFAKQSGVGEVGLHLFADGKDSKPRSAKSLIDRLKSSISRIGIGKIYTFSGRHYALDRDGHWERTERVYRIMLGGEDLAQGDMYSAIDSAYKQNQNDDMIEPTLLVKRGVRDGDALFFADFREDSIRQIASPFVVEEFFPFEKKKFKNLFVATMTEYSKYFSVPVAFPADKIDYPLGRVLSEAGKTQFLIAETEKYAHVTYFFNGFQDKPFAGQFPVLIPSKNVSRHDEYPEMMAEEVANRVIESVENKGFDFILANFANSDIVAHTGNYDAAVRAVQTVDKQVGRIMQACLANGAALCITSDHGNVEVMADPFTGKPETTHDPNPVPFYLIENGRVRDKDEAEVRKGEREVVGILSDVAPTVLDILGLQKPKEMTGSSLIPRLL